MPAGSIAGRWEARDSGTSVSTARRPIAATGTFMRKIQPHQQLVSNQPPTMGPMGRATARVGKATLSTVTSSPTARTPNVIAARAHHRRALLEVISPHPPLLGFILT